MAKIIIIDDDEILSKLLVKHLENHGHEVSSASNGTLGIQILEANSFDLVITDIIMPDQDGLEVMMWLQKHTPMPKVITMTGGSELLHQEYVARLCVNFKPDRILLKPIDVSRFHMEVADVLNH